MSFFNYPSFCINNNHSKKILDILVTVFFQETFNQGVCHALEIWGRDQKQNVNTVPSDDAFPYPRFWTYSTALDLNFPEMMQSK